MGDKTTMTYFAYGSNLCVEQMKHRCPTARPICKAALKGYRLEFAGYPGNGYATIVPDPDSEVPGGLWRITLMDLMALDKYEGYPRFYARETVTVRPDGTDTEVDAITYIMTPGNKPAMPSHEYRCVIQSGYRIFGINYAILAQAIDRTIASIKAE